MRRFWLGLAVIACMMRAMPLAAQSSDPDINVRLERTLGAEPQIYMDGPGYLAVFEIVPGRGIVQLYPLTKHEVTNLLEPGLRQLGAARADMARRVSWQASVAVRAFTPGVLTSVTAPTPAFQPRGLGLLPYRHVVAIAATQPLRVGTPDRTMSRLHLEVPTLWSPGEFEATTDDLEALVNAVAPASRRVSVSMLTVPTPIYTMVLYSPQAWALTSPASPDYDLSEIYARCLGMVMRVPVWYLADGLCAPAPTPTTVALTRASDSLAIRPVAATITTVVRAGDGAGPARGGGPSTARDPAETRIVGGRELVPAHAGADAPSRSPAIAPRPTAPAAPPREEGTRQAPPGPSSAPVSASRPTSGASRERLVP
ncbi:MAG: hypothetical protein HY275_00405 [Gemmatimonadetes bacterium]|nr:hypothetical protein [Gemmatimonadota bacterium]